MGLYAARLFAGSALHPVRLIMNNKTVNTALGACSQLYGVITETVNRTLSLPGAGAYFLGLQATKKLRLQVMILRDEQGVPVIQEAVVAESMRAASQLFLELCNVKLLWREPAIVTLPNPAPTAALDVHCDAEGWKEDFDIAGRYFRQQMAKTAVGTLTGYACPITVFIVRKMAVKAGCSLGPLANYVTVVGRVMEKSANSRILAHEVGHACLLLHSEDEDNLMYPIPGTQLEPWQAAMARNSRHITYL